MYDVIIRNGRLLDGEGSPWIRADIGIREGRLAQIGRVVGSARREIDVGESYVTPGWIDMMDQSGAVLPQNGFAQNKLRAGITTAIAGEGGTPVPSAELANYFRTLERQGISLNFGTYYGSAQARVDVMGDVADRCTPEQMSAMRAHVGEAMRAGALGIATALIYPPACFQTTDDLIELSRVAASYGGIYACHLRDEGAELLQGIAEAIEIGRRSGIQVEIFHFKAMYAPMRGQLIAKAGALIETARAEGVNIAADMYVYGAGCTGLDITVPNWVFADGEQIGFERLTNPEIRTRLKKEVAAGSQPRWSNLVEACGGWEHIVLADARDAAFDPYRGQSIADIGRKLGCDPADAAWDIVLRARPHRAAALFFAMSEPDIEAALRFPWTSIGSDAGANLDDANPQAPHPRANGNHPRVISEYVRARSVLSLEEAVRKMTSWPASRMHLHDRGAIREGLRADLTIFDYDRLDDGATYENPAARPTGINYVIVNGQIVIDQGAHTGAKPGMVLRGQGAESD